MSVSLTSLQSLLFLSDRGIPFVLQTLWGESGYNLPEQTLVLSAARAFGGMPWILLAFQVQPSPVVAGGTFMSSTGCTHLSPPLHQE